MVEDSASLRREDNIIQASAGMDALELPAIDRRREVGCRVGDVGHQAESGRQLIGGIIRNDLPGFKGNGRNNAGHANSREKRSEHGYYVVVIDAGIIY